MTTERELAEVLAPCPLCGAEPVLRHDVPGIGSEAARRGWVGRWSVKCRSATDHFVSSDGATRDEAIAAWNRRPALLSRADGGEAPRAVRGMPPFGQLGVPNA